MVQWNPLSGGPWVPSISVYRGKKLDVKATARHVQRLAENGAAGAIVNGTTGEGHLLSTQEKVAVIRAIGAMRRDGRIPSSFALLSGTGTQDIGEAKRIIEAARENGFHGILALPHKTASKKFEFYSALAQACTGKKTLALMLYNHPKLDARYSVTPALLTRLMNAHGSVIGIKDSAGNKNLLEQWARIKSARKPLVAVGEDTLIVHGLRNGAKAAIAGTGNTKEGLQALTAIFRHQRGRGMVSRAEKAQQRLNKEVNVLLGTTRTGAEFRRNARERRLR